MNAPMTKAEAIAAQAAPLNITFTTWDGLTATNGDIKSAEWAALTTALEAPGENKSKGACKMLKLATFSHGCKAIDLQGIHGIEGDYDAGEVSLADAAARLQAAGVEAFLYTSASHTADKPRWRVLAPLSKVHTVAEHGAAMALLNGALGGILAPESFDASRRFFYGRVEGVQYETRPTTGACIDTVRTITPIGKPGVIGKATTAAPAQFDDRGRIAVLAAVTADTIADLHSAVPVLKAERAEDRGLWIEVLHALASLKETEFDVEAYEMAYAFSERGNTFTPDDFEKVWDGIHPIMSTHKTVFHLAQEDGWINPRKGTSLRDLGTGTFDAPTLPKTDARDGTHDTRPLTESGNALRMLDAHRERLRYVPDAQAWLAWDGQTWRWDAGAAGVRSLAAAMGGAIYAEGARHLGEMEHFAKWARKSQELRTINNGVALLSDCAQVRLPMASIDANPFAIGFDQGRQVLDLRNGATRAAAPADYITKSLRVESIGDAAGAVRWVQFLEQVFNGDAELIDWLQRFTGYLLTGSTQEHIFLFCFGHGANGKSVFMEVLRNIMGDYSRSLASETLSESRRQAGGATSDLAALIGARLALCPETEDNTALAESLVKGLVGGDTMPVRDVYKGQVSLTPHFKLIMAGNHKPIVRGNDNGMWRRVRLIPFSRTFAPGERDPRLLDQLRAEAPHILAWMVAGCLEWQRRGLADTPASVRDATDTYRADQDITGAWLDECTVKGDAYRTPASDLYASYSAWSLRNGLRPASARAFTPRLEERGYSRGRTKVLRFWDGLALAPLGENEEDFT